MLSTMLSNIVSKVAICTTLAAACCATLAQNEGGDAQKECGADSNTFYEMRTPAGSNLSAPTGRECVRSKFCHEPACHAYEWHASDQLQHVKPCKA